METVLAAKPWFTEPSLVPIPWHKSTNLTDQLHGKRLKIAVMWDDGVVIPHPSITRALTMMVDRLKAIDNVEVVEWKPHRHAYAWEIIVGTLYLPFTSSCVDSYTGRIVLRRRWEGDGRADRFKRGAVATVVGNYH